MANMITIYGWQIQKYILVVDFEVEIHIETAQK